MLEGAQVVVDLSNSPSFAEDEVTSFFRTSTTNLLEAETKAGVRHHVILSIVIEQHQHGDVQRLRPLGTERRVLVRATGSGTRCRTESRTGVVARAA